MIYCISDAEWAHSYDARIELDGGDVLLHSRGGATGGRPARNTDYEKALATIIRRLRAQDSSGNQVIRRILLDSTVARQYSADERVLMSSQEMSGLSDEEVATIVRRRAREWGQRPGAKGGNSTKALRIETADRARSSIRSTLKLMHWKEPGIGAPNIERLSNTEQRRVTVADVHRAVFRLVSGEDAPNFADSRDYDVMLDDGTRLAPKRIFGLALEEALGIEAYPGHFSAGWGMPCFELIEAAGYKIVEKADSSMPTDMADEDPAELPLPPEDWSAAEGNPKIVVHFRRERDRGLARRKKAAFRAEHGRLFCERCKMDPAQVYSPEVAAACIEVHHAVIQVKDMGPEHMTSIDDLECLCANCHRITHREMPQ